ncbi:MAG: hypothetical protein Q7K55_01965 [Candidatus Levybacteria bacterium]|nr:hypothetical protein [Candidatus Levybacteria bacterium]
MGYFSAIVIVNIQHGRPPVRLIDIIYLLPIHILGNYMRASVSPENSRSWKESFMPFVPVDKYVSGLIFLARHGNRMIISRNSAT